MIKEEHNKLQGIIRDLKQSIPTSSSYDDKRLLSGDKSQNHLLLSPFERKLATYQKSAEMRKN